MSNMSLAKVAYFLLFAMYSLAGFGSQIDDSLHRAVARSDYEACLQLIESGAELDEVDGAGNNLLHINALATVADRDRDFEQMKNIRRLLLEKGVAIDGLNLKKQTPLQVAIVRYGKKSVSSYRTQFLRFNDFIEMAADLWPKDLERQLAIKREINRHLPAKNFLTKKGIERCINANEAVERILITLTRMSLAK